MTGIEGDFRIPDVPAGTYEIESSMIGYNTVTVTEAVVAAGEVLRLDLVLTSEAIAVDEVVVEVRALRNTEASLLKERQKAPAVSDAISSEDISRAGSGNAAEAMSHVSGATVMEGKYVYIRGLGDRYSTVQLTGISRTNDGALDPRPMSGSPALSGAVPPPDDGFFQAVAYRGAFDADNLWMAGWTFLDHLGILVQGVETVVASESAISGRHPISTWFRTIPIPGTRPLPSGTRSRSRERSGSISTMPSASTSAPLSATFARREPTGSSSAATASPAAPTSTVCSLLPASRPAA